MGESHHHGTSAHLHRAVQHVSHFWLPIAPAAVQELKSSLDNSSVPFSSDRVWSYLHADAGLFSLTLRELARRGIPASDHQSASPEILRSIITSLPPSEHGAVQRGQESGVNTLVGSIVSTLTVRSLAPSCNIEIHEACATALLRQLGLLLITWNYPNLYRRALLNSRHSGTIDYHLSKVLGFSPSMLVIRLTREWGLSERQLSALGHAAEVSADAEHLVTLCEVGEALARACDPESYPTAHEDWGRARSFIVERLGFEGLSAIRSSVISALKYYRASAPELFPDIPLPLRAPRAGDAWAKGALGAEQFDQNFYLKHCPSDVQQQFSAMYGTIRERTTDDTALSYLAREIVPALGFRFGCLYLVDPETQLLTPRLALGPTTIARYSTVRHSSNSLAFDPVVAAYRSTVPIVDHDRAHPEGPTSVFAGSLGGTSRLGAIYLEMESQRARAAPHEGVTYFKAIRQTFLDLLHLD